jgi:hypothetical protein
VSQPFNISIMTSTALSTLNRRFNSRAGCRIDSNPISEKSLRQFRHWHNLCEQKHSACTKKEPDFMLTRLLDVGDAGTRVLKLVRWPTQVVLPYVALSHCRGESKPCTTTNATIHHHLKGIPLSFLPQNFNTKYPLFNRAWVVQERVLSRRKLIFTKDQVVLGM